MYTAANVTTPSTTIPAASTIGVLPFDPRLDLDIGGVLARAYHAPCFVPIHQTRPISAVF